MLTTDMQCSTGAALAFGEFIFSPLLKTVGKPKWQLFAASIGTGLFCALMGSVTQYSEGRAIGVSVMTFDLFDKSY